MSQSDVRPNVGDTVSVTARQDQALGALLAKGFEIENVDLTKYIVCGGLIIYEVRTLGKFYYGIVSSVETARTDGLQVFFSHFASSRDGRVLHSPAANCKRELLKHVLSNDMLYRGGDGVVVWSSPSSNMTLTFYPPDHPWCKDGIGAQVRALDQH